MRPPRATASSCFRADRNALLSSSLAATDASYATSPTLTLHPASLKGFGLACCTIVTAFEPPPAPPHAARITKNQGRIMRPSLHLRRVTEHRRDEERGGRAPRE